MERVISWSLANRPIVIFLTIIWIFAGVSSLTRLPIDAVPDIFKAMADGDANATVELTPNMAGPAFDALEKYKADGTEPPKWIQTESKLFTAADDNQAIYEQKKDLGY